MQTLLHLLLKKRGSQFIEVFRNINDNIDDSDQDQIKLASAGSMPLLENMIPVEVTSAYKFSRNCNLFIMLQAMEPQWSYFSCTVHLPKPLP